MNIISGNNWEFILILSLLILFLIVVIILLRKKKPKRPEYSKDISAVFNALKYSHRNDGDSFIVWLKKATKYFPEEVYLYIVIGDTVRENNPREAILVHRSLLFKKHITPDERSSILFSLALDYLKLNKKIKALSAFKQSYALFKRADTLKNIVEIERSLQKYTDAIEHMKELNKITGKLKNEGIPEIVYDAMRFYNSRKDMEKLRNWLNMHGKTPENESFFFLAGIYIEFEEGQIERGVKLCGEFLKKFPEDELNLRGFLISLENGTEINRKIEGTYSELFDLISGEMKHPNRASFEGIRHDSTLFYHLYSKTDIPEDEKKMIGAVGDRKKLFVCNSCGSIVPEFSLFCKECGKPISIGFNLIK